MMKVKKSMERKGNERKGEGWVRLRYRIGAERKEGRDVGEAEICVSQVSAMRRREVQKRLF